MTNKNKSIVREGYTKSNLKEPPTADRPPPPRSQVAFRPSNGVNTARIVRVAATVPEVCFHNVKLGQGCFCPHCPTACFGDETTAKHQGWCASINPDPCNCGIATKGASAWCPHYDLPIVNQPGCPDCAHEKTTGQWDPRAAAVKQDPHCATCKCFSEEPSCICEHGPNGPPLLRRQLLPWEHEFACPRYRVPEKASARPIPPGRMCNTHGNWNCSECCPPENGNGDAT